MNIVRMKLLDFIRSVNTNPINPGESRCSLMRNPQSLEGEVDISCIHIYATNENKLTRVNHPPPEVIHGYRISLAADNQRPRKEAYGRPTESEVRRRPASVTSPGDQHGGLW